MALDPAVTRTRAEVKPAPTTQFVPPPKPEPPLVAALRSALEKHPDEARRLLDQYDRNDRELLFALLRLTAGVSAREIEQLGPDEVAAALGQLGALSAQLRRKARLTLHHVCFCRAIEGFGRYQRLPARHAFQAGSDGRPGERVQVYAEVQNFSSRRAGEQYETVLESRLEIRDAQGRKVVTLDLGRSPDRSHSPRQDYFLNFELHVPPRMPPGLYTLWVTVKDVTDEGQGKAAARSVGGETPPNPRQASCSLDFTVCPPGTAADDEATP
jgi:hypothetical protein